MKASPMMALGVIAVAVVAVAVLGTLWALSQIASADPDGAVTLVHVNPDGSDYTGNPYCDTTDWSGGKNEPVVLPRGDCNNITSQNHVIRTQGWNVSFTVHDWSLDSLGANPVIVLQGRCGDIAEVTGRPNWDPTNDDEQCVVMHSSTPGETRVTLTYDEGGFIIITNPVVKEWDSLVDSVILKYGDLEKVKVYFDADGDTIVESSEYKWMYLPKDVNSDGVRNADDEHLLDRQSTWQDHGVIWDDALKRLRSAEGPVQFIEVVHGEHDILVNAEYITVHHPTEGAIILATIESDRGCTYFTDPLGVENFGTAMNGISDAGGRFVGPQVAPEMTQPAELTMCPNSHDGSSPQGDYDITDLWVDTVCEEQATIHIDVGYPGPVGSLRLPAHEEISINWVTSEVAKQPQIRWAGEEIVLAKRWALPDDWYPNPGQEECPVATIYDVDGDGDIDIDDADMMGRVVDDTIIDYQVRYVRKDPSPGDLVGAYVDADGDGHLDSLNPPVAGVAVGDIDRLCISKALYESEVPGQVDVEAQLIERICPIEPGPCTEYLINKHAFLIWYLKIYQVKLTNVDGAREFHNAGDWTFGDGEDTEEDTLNVSQDALLRVKVKGWFESGNPSGRGDVCLDMDGDGDGADSDPGEPYPAVPAMGCADPDDQLLLYGHWVLPDDLPLLAGPDAINTRPNWDVMSEPDAAKTTAIGPKSTLDSHDTVLRPWLGRKTVVPDGAITTADAIMPPLKIRASIADGDAGFLKEALKGAVYGGTNDYHSVMIPADPEIPAVVANGGYDWDSWLGLLGPYPFWTLTGQTGAPYPYYIELYTDNRGEGMFFANGDYNLSFDDCRTDPLSGAPDCNPGDVVGESNITVIGDYPYFRKHPAVQSNPVLESWEWGGFKIVTAEALDPNHTLVIAHLKDRDGYCKWDVDYPDVTFSPSLNPVQGEEIEFILNTEIGSIIDVSPNALYSAPHTPLGTATVTGLEDGVIINRRDAVAQAEDERVLAYYDEARAVVEDDECQAWVLIEHPVGEDPDVGVVFHDPEGVITRHWPPSELNVSLVQGWNDSCYVGPEQPIEDAVADIAGDIVAIYRFRNEEQMWGRWFPGHPGISTITTLNPYDQLFLLVAANAQWLMEITALPASVDLGLGWNSVCYAGVDKATEEATADIAGDLSILLTYGSDQMWRRYMPGLDWANNITTLYRFTSVLMLVTAEGATWVFDPPATPTGPATAQPSLSAGVEEGETPLSPLASSGEFCSPVFAGTYYGTVSVGGQPAPDGTTIGAIIDGIVWASATTSGGRYVFEVPMVMPVSPPCFAGGTLSFMCDGVTAAESSTWASGPRELDLTCGELPPEVTVRVDQGIAITALGVPAPGLSAFTIDATYNPAVFTPAACTSGPDDNFDMALCTPDYEPNVVRATGIKAECGLTGDVALANIAFDATAPVCPDDLMVSMETLADCEGADMPVIVDHKWWVGDADRDFDKDAVDALFILQYVVGMRAGSAQCPPPPGAIHLPSADADCDGDVDAVDALFVLQHVVGLRPVLCPSS